MEYKEWNLDELQNLYRTTMRLGEPRAILVAAAIRTHDILRANRIETKIMETRNPAYLAIVQDQDRGVRETLCILRAGRDRVMIGVKLPTGKSMAAPISEELIPALAKMLIANHKVTTSRVTHLRRPRK